MQNAPAMLAQKMMNRQAAYAPVGMVSQNMSGNKKSAGGALRPLELAFDTLTATSGLKFSNGDKTVLNSTGANVSSSKANVGTFANAAGSWYWEITLNNSTTSLIGVGTSSFICNASNQVGITAGTVAYYAASGALYIGGTIVTTVTAATDGDVIGIKLNLTSTTGTITILKNNTAIISNFNVVPYIATFNSLTSWFPIWSSGFTNVSATISDNIYSAPGYIPISYALITVSASASVPAVADGKYDVYTFNASGTFTAESTGAVRALVIAGGGAGGQTYGGGGAGGYQEKGATVTPQTYTVTVGAGGAGQAFTGSDQSLVSNNGNNSVFSAITSTGGGGGGAYSNSTATSARTGGSGGGGSLVLGGNVSGAAGTTGQGFAGGNAAATGNAGGGGGGGASAVGAAGTTTGGGNGGAGVSSNITGTSVTRAGGGGGSFFSTGGTIGTGGAGGGGAGASTGINAAGVGVAGSANTGGGAGGSHSDGLSSTSASGGSGIVIIRVRARA